MRKPIGINEAALMSVLSQIAQEDTQRLAADYEADTLPIPRRVIDDTFAHHRPQALKVIRRETRRPRQGLRRLASLAACLLLISGAGVYALWRQPPAADIPTPPLASTIATPAIQRVDIPQGWRGSYYPAWLPKGYVFKELREKASAQEALYENPTGKGILTFSESSETLQFELQGDESATFSYRQLDDQTVALVAVSQVQGAFVVWDVNYSQTLQVFLSGTLDDATAFAVAQSVRLIDR